METYNQMLYITGCSVLLSAVTLVSSQQMGPAIGFVTRHPDALWSILSLSLASTIGQLFILYTIKQFGALVFATIMTTRQFLSILLSCVLFMHPLTWEQWGGTGLVFGSLYAKAFGGKKKSSSEDGGKDKLSPLPTTSGGSDEIMSSNDAAAAAQAAHDALLGGGEPKPSPRRKSPP